MSRVVMFVLNDCRTDARVIREAATLAAAGHVVTVMARPADPWAAQGDRELRDGFEIIRVPIPGRIRRLVPRRVSRARSEPPATTRAHRAGARRVSRALRSVVEGLAWLVRWQLGVVAWARAAASVAPDADVWHGHDLTGLAAARIAQRRRAGRLVYDAHELYLEAGATAAVPRWARAIVGRSERRWARAADLLLTVNDGLAAVLAGLGARPILVVHNCPPRWDPRLDSASPLRAAAGVAAEAPLALYHGTLVPHRGIDVLIAALAEPGCEQLHAVFLGDGSLGGQLRALRDSAGVGSRVHVLAPVDPSDLLRWISGADVGVVAIAPSTRNHVLSTPNKLFECLAAGTPVVASDFPAMHEIVVDDPLGPLGVVCDPTSAAAVGASIRELVAAPAPERAALRRRCLAAAHDRWNWEHESAGLVRWYATAATAAGVATAAAGAG